MDEEIGVLEMGQLWRDTLRLVDHMGTQEWILVAVVGIIVGLVCLRGFGSRADY